MGDNINGALGNGYYNNVTPYPTAIYTNGALWGKTVTQIDLGNAYGEAMTSDGQLYTWGYGGEGELGNGSNNDIYVPQAVNMSAFAGKTISNFSSQTAHTVVLTSDGDLYNWGMDVNWRGDGSSVWDESSDSSIAVPFDSTETLDTISLGGSPVTSLKYISSNELNGVVPDHSAGLVDASVQSYDNQTSTLPSSYLYLAPPSITSLSQDSGSIMGNNDITIFGSGFVSSDIVTFDSFTATVKSISPDGTSMVVTVPPNTEEYSSGEAGVEIKDVLDQTAYYWGYTYNEIPITVTSITPNVGYMPGGDTITINGTGLMTTEDVTFGGSKAQIQSVSSDGTSIVLKTPAHDNGVVDVTIDCNIYGEQPFLGSGEINNCSQSQSTNSANYTDPSSFTYTDYPPIISSVTPSKGPTTGGQTITIEGSGFKKHKHFYTKIAQSALSQHSCGLENGLAYCWGAGEMGNGTYNNSATPVAVDTSGVLAGKTIVDIAVGGNTTVAVASDGSVYSWGQGWSGELGNGITNSSTVPVAVDMTGVLAGKKVVHVAMGQDSTSVLTSDGNIYSWGENYDGELGDGTTDGSSVPVAVDMTGVLAGKTITAIAGGGDDILALASDGTVYGWGANWAGQLGIGINSSNSPTPVAVDMTGVLAGKKVISIATGIISSLVATSDGGVYSWGSGELGTTATNSSTAPVAVDMTGVLAGKKVISVATGDENSIVATDDGEVFGWGTNNNGEMGNNTTGESPTPVAIDTSGVLAGEDIIDVGINESSVLVRSLDGMLFSWGYGNDGELGNSATDSSLVPVSLDTSAPGTITLGGENLSNINYVSSNEIIAVVPAHAPASTDLTITNYDGQSMNLAHAYSFIGNPDIESASPSTGYTTGGDEVTIYGTNLSMDDVVTFDNLIAKNQSVSNDGTRLTVTTPADTAGNVSIKIVDPLNQTDVLNNGFKYIAPSTTVITPANSRNQTQAINASSTDPNQSAIATTTSTATGSTTKTTGTDPITKSSPITKDTKSTSLLTVIMPYLFVLGAIIVIAIPVSIFVRQKSSR